MADETPTVSEFVQGPQGVRDRLAVVKDLLTAGKAADANQRCATALNLARKVKDVGVREALLKECAEVKAKIVEALRAAASGKPADKPVVAPK